jgi:hypothetical protein
MNHTEYKNLRESIGTQEIVASLLGIARETIARRETGRATIGTEATFALQFLAGGAPEPVAQDPRDSEIDDIREAIADIENNPSYRMGGTGETLEQHRARFEREYLDYLRSCYDEAKRVLPLEVDLFHASKPADLDEVATLYAFQAHLGDDDVAGWDRWDKDFNPTPWVDPNKLNPQAQISLDILRKRLTRLERSQA